MDIQFIEKQNDVRPPRPRTMTEKLMAKYPRLVPTKERANVVLLCIAIFFFLLSFVVVIGYNMRVS